MIIPGRTLIDQQRDPGGGKLQEIDNKQLTSSLLNKKNHLIGVQPPVLLQNSLVTAQTKLQLTEEYAEYVFLG